MVAGLVGGDGMALRGNTLLVVTNALGGAGANALRLTQGGNAAVPLRAHQWPDPATVAVTPFGDYVLDGRLDASSPVALPATSCCAVRRRRDRWRSATPQVRVEHMRLLVLGGTAFVGRAMAVEAVRRGHDVVCAARGESGQVPAGARLVPVDRDAEDGLAALEGERFDAVVDVAPLSYPWVDRALRAFAEHARHWSFVSTLNVYADTATRGQTPATGPLVESLAQHATFEEMKALGSAGADLYGGIKVASENAVRQAMGDHAFVTRPGLITGPGDRSDRFGYWPARFARGGRVVVPDVPTQPIQFIDVRDYAEWLVAAAEQDITGTFDAVGPHQPLPDMLEQIAAAVGTAGGKPAELVPVTVEQLHSAGVNPWAGPCSLPLWLPAEYDGMKSHDPAPSLAAGLPVRPLADTVSAALAHERELGVDRERKAGLTLAEEQNILIGL